MKHFIKKWIIPAFLAGYVFFFLFYTLIEVFLVSFGKENITTMFSIERLINKAMFSLAVSFIFTLVFGMGFLISKVVGILSKHKDG